MFGFSTSTLRIAAIAVVAVVATLIPPSAARSQEAGGERIVFVWVDTEDFSSEPRSRMLSMNPDGSDIRTVMDGDAGREPDVSPDGTTIVYVLDGDLWLSDIDGGNRRRFTNAQADGRHYWDPSFSPDGTEIAYRVSGDGIPGGIYASRADRFEERLIAENGTNERGEEFSFGSPSWSPDGTRLALSRNYRGPGYPEEDGGSSLVVVDADGTDLHEVPGTREAFMNLGVSDTAWSPDGTSIAYLKITPSDDADIVITAVDGSSKRVVLKGRAWVSGLAWSPVGREIVYESWRDIEGLSDLDGPPRDLFAIRPDGTGKRHILEKDGAESDPTFVAPQASRSATARSTDRACPKGEVPDSGFTDLGSSEHRAAIDCAAWWGVAAGETETTYAPSRTVTRAQMASFIARAITESGGELPTPSKDHFGDDDGSVHELSINALAEAGIVAGVGDGRFAPSTPVARDQMARFLAQALEHRSGELLPASADYFADDAGDTHENAINKTAEAGITAGNGSGYAPTDAVSRDQMASFLVRLLDVVVEAGDVAPPTR